MFDTGEWPTPNHCNCYVAIFFFDNFKGRSENRPFATNSHMAENVPFWRANECDSLQNKAISISQA